MALNLSEKVDRIDFKVDSLESILGTFIVSTNTALLRLEREMREFKNEMREFKDESERNRKRMDKHWGKLANKLGTIVEDIVAPNVPRIAKEFFGIEDIDLFAVRVRKKKFPQSRATKGIRCDRGIRDTFYPERNQVHASRELY